MNLVGLHDRSAAAFAPKDTWILDTIALSENPAAPMYSPDHHWMVRVNWGYGSTGTIPHPTSTAEFIGRLKNYVRNSSNNKRWIIGNEPNLPREWPDLVPIHPSQYGEFFIQCRRAIKSVSGHEQDEVLIAGSGPWNDDYTYAGNSNGDWIKYFVDTIGYCYGEFDGFAIHSYTHGYDANLVWSDAKMNPPFQDKYYNFRNYLNYINAIPDSFANLPIYLTEANGNGSWQAVGLMPAMAEEIDDHNRVSSSRKIKNLIFYRWSKDDNYNIVDKQDVMNEYIQTVARNFQSPTSFPNKILLPKLSLPEKLTGTTTVPVPLFTATVKAILLNVRDNPGTEKGKVIGSVRNGEKISVYEELILNGQLWYRIGVNQWVIAEWVDRSSSGAPQDKWQRSRAFTAGWEGGFQDLDWDTGNWTTGIVGKGEKKGTKYGISAASYPNLDIKNITREMADKIYYEDYWIPSGAAALDWPMCLLVFDTAINFGTNTAEIWLKQSKGNPYLFIGLRLRGYRKSKSWKQAGDAWVDRTIDLLLEAGE